MDDLISRQDAIKAIDEKAKRIKNADTLNGLAGAVGILFDLPSYNSINSELSEDAISRQAVMDCFKKWQPYMAIRLWDFEQELSALPSINPQPCEDAVSRPALLKLMGEEPFNWTDSNQELQAVEDYRNFRNMVEQLPSVKPQEPKTGYWILQPSNKEQGERDFIWWKCSECGQVIFSETEKDRREYHAFCGRCGARMAEPQERSE